MRARAAGVLLAGALLADVLALPARADGPFTIAVPGDGAPSGEVGFFDATGRRVGALTGLGDPAHLVLAGDDRFLVLDRSDCRLLVLDPDGHVWRDQKCPPSNVHPDRALLLEDGHILLESESRSTEIDAAGSVVAEVDAPPDVRLLGAARLPDGSTIYSSSEEPQPILRSGPGGTGLERIPLGEGYGIARYALFLEPEAPPSSGFLLWHHSFKTVTRMAFENGRLVAKGFYPLPLIWKVAADAKGIVAISDDFEICRAALDGSTTRFRVPFAPLGAVYLPGRDLYAVSYVRLPPNAWPESWRVGAPVTRFPWPRLALFSLFGAVLGAAIFFARGRPPAAEPGGGTADVPPGPPLDASSSKTRARRLATTAGAFVPLVLYAAALVLTRRGVLQLDAAFTPGRDVPLLFGFGLALAAAAWDRIATGRKDPYWQAVLAAPAEDRRLLLALLGSGVVVVAGLVLLYQRRAAKADVDSTCLWAALHVVLLAMVAASFRGRVRLLAAARAHWIAVVPFAAACVTNLYRLTDIPTNVHFDFVYCSFSALQLLDGRLLDIFSPGFVPVPVIGLLPEMLGFLLAGPTELGFRLGPALAGISGVLAVYVLGTVWRGRATGLLGAIFLAGAGPWIHFSRMSTTGVSAVAGLWVLVFFALALKTNRAGWWLLGGWFAGWCFYLWPASRVAPVACFLAGLALALRAPRATARRLPGPPLMALAFLVWLVPLVPAWIRTPNLALPRAQESLDVYKPESGLNLEKLRASFGRPLALSAGWFFATPDLSTQGSMSPALNTVEATLFVAGVALAFAAGFSLNLLLLLDVALVLLVLGAFAGTPPWYTRMLPSLPVACTLMGAAAATLLEYLRLPGGRARAAALALAATCALALSPARNLPRYVAYESEERPTWEATALGRRLRTLEPGRTIYIVLADRSDWSLNVEGDRHPPRLGEMLPFVWNRHLVEIPEVDDRLALAPGPKAIVVPRARIATDVPRLLAKWPRARAEELPGAGGPWATILLID